MTRSLEVERQISLLFDQHGGFVYRTLGGLGVQESALDDAMQDVFITAFRRWSSFEGRSSKRTWLFGIARRIAFRYRRAARSRAQRLPPSQGNAGVDPYGRAHAAGTLNSLLRHVDSDKRQIFVLCEVEGMTAAEAADALRIPLGSAYSRRRAAWQVLQRASGLEEERLRRQLAGAKQEPADRQRLWALIAARLPKLGPAKGLPWLAPLKWGLVGSGALLGLVSLSVAAVDVAPAATMPKPARRAVEPGPNKEHYSPAPRAATLTAPREPTTAPTAGSKLQSKARSAKQALSEPTQPAQEELSQELALIRAAQRANAMGKGQQAIAALDEHEKRFPTGQLSRERGPARITAL